MNPIDPTTAVVATYEGRPLANPDEDIYDQGLAFDLETLVDRRRVLKLLGLTGLGAGIFAVAGCAPSGSASASASTSFRLVGPGDRRRLGRGRRPTRPPVPSSPRRPAARTPRTARTGPTSSTRAASSARTSGRASATCRARRRRAADHQAAHPGRRQRLRAVPDAAVYLWHCDRDGRYSLYSQGVTDQNYLRGVQAAGSDGVVTFTSIFPACYSGRWPHIHFEVYPNLAAATDDANKIATSQIALPKDTCDAVYATDGYAQSVRTMSG